MNYAVIMAGGTGQTALAAEPAETSQAGVEASGRSNASGPVFRAAYPVFDMRNILALTNIEYADMVRENLPDLPLNNVIAEPAVRDTAGAIGLAATILAKYDPEAVMALLTADQLIEPPEVLQQALTDAFKFMSGNPDALITFGIRPTFPSTQLGYIKCADPRACPKCRNTVYSVEAFKEKPDLDGSQAVRRERRVLLEFRDVRLAGEDDSGQFAEVPAGGGRAASANRDGLGHVGTGEDAPGVVPEAAQDQHRLCRDGEGQGSPRHPARLQMAGHGLLRRVGRCHQVG